MEQVLSDLEISAEKCSKRAVAAALRLLLLPSGAVNGVAWAGRMQLAMGSSHGAFQILKLLVRIVVSGHSWADRKGAAGAQPGEFAHVLTEHSKG